VPIVHKFWEPHFPGEIKACPGLSTDSYTYQFVHISQAGYQITGPYSRKIRVVIEGSCSGVAANLILQDV